MRAFFKEHTKPCFNYARGQPDETKLAGITLDVRPDPRSSDAGKKPDTLDRKEPMARMERTLRLHCINLQMAVSAASDLFGNIGIRIL